MNNTCRRCTPGCKCVSTTCMMAYCADCAKLCRCWHEGYTIVSKIDPPWIRELKSKAVSSWDWFSDHWIVMVGIIGYAAGAYGFWQIASEFNKEIEAVPHSKAIRLGMTIVLLTIVLSRGSKK